MALVLLLGAVMLLAVYGWLTYVAGADTRSGVDGENAFGRRTHCEESWWG